MGESLQYLRLELKQLNAEVYPLFILFLRIALLFNTLAILFKFHWAYSVKTNVTSKKKAGSHKKKQKNDLIPSTCPTGLAC